MLGLFTGIALMIALGIWLNEREKKRGVPKHRNPPPPPNATGLGIYINGQRIASLESTSFPTEIQDVVNLQQQLKSAIDRDDFEESRQDQGFN